MKIRYEVGNILNAPQGYYLATFMPASFEIDNDTTEKIVEVFNSKKKLKAHYPEYCFLGGDCLKEDTALFLITRRDVEDESSINNLYNAMYEMNKIVEEENITRIAMAKDYINTDVMDWDEIEEALKNAFDDTDLEVVIYVLDSSDLRDEYETPEEDYEEEEEDSNDEEENFYEAFAHICDNYKDSIMDSIMNDVRLLMNIFKDISNNK